MSLPICILTYHMKWVSRYNVNLQPQVLIVPYSIIPNYIVLHEYRKIKRNQQMLLIFFNNWHKMYKRSDIEFVIFILYVPYIRCSLIFFVLLFIFSYTTLFTQKPFYNPPKIYKPWQCHKQRIIPFRLDLGADWYVLYIIPSSIVNLKSLLFIIT